MNPQRWPHGAQHRGGAAGIGRRHALACLCAGGLAWPGASAWAAVDDSWQPPERLPRPDTASDEGGLWAMMDREEARLRRSAFNLRTGGIREYVSGIACKLGGAHCADTRVYVVRTPWFNASMAPNGMMQVWTGLLLRVDNEAQLAAVIGHELGHYLQRHSVQMMRDLRGRTAAMSFMALFGVVGLVGSLATAAGAASFSRENETESDLIGLKLMHQVGYDTREAAKVWANLRAELSAGAGGDPAKRSVMFASHPASDERQKLLEDRSAAHAGGDLGAERFAQQLEPLMPDLLDDELRRGQFDESLVLFQRLAERRPTRGDLRWARGEAFRQRAQADDAVAAQAEFEAALRLQQPPVQAHRSLGLLHRAAGRKPQARQAFEAYLQLAPAAPDAAMVQSYLTDL